MSLEHEPPRLTPEQRDRVLDLAARLQAQHEAGIRVDDLAQAAAEAGIDPRFVHQAARSIVQTPPEPPVRVISAPDRNLACILLGILTLLNALLSLTHLGEAIGRVGAVWLVLFAAVAGHWSVKGRLPVWLVPASLIMTLLATQTSLELLGHRGSERYREITMMLIVGQTLISFLAGAVTRVIYYIRNHGAVAWPR